MTDSVPEPTDEAKREFGEQLLAMIREAAEAGRARRGYTPPKTRPDREVARALVLGTYGWGLEENETGCIGVDGPWPVARPTPEQIGYSYAELGLRNPDDDEGDEQ